MCDEANILGILLQHHVPGQHPWIPESHLPEYILPEISGFQDMGGDQPWGTIV